MHSRCFPPRKLTALRSRSPPDISRDTPIMTDLLWLAALGGLFAATFAYIRLCDAA